jgi:hypothetical protein
MHVCTENGRGECTISGRGTAVSASHVGDLVLRQRREVQICARAATVDAVVTAAAELPVTGCAPCRSD